MNSCGLNGAQTMGSGYRDGASAAHAANPGTASSGLPERNFRNRRRANERFMSGLPNGRMGTDHLFRRGAQVVCPRCSSFPDLSYVRSTKREAPLKIGIAGTGRMGSAVAGRLLGLGHEVAAWNRTREKARALEAAGVVVARTAADLAARSEIVITFLTDAAAIDAMYHGEGGLLAGEVRGKLFIDMSTVRPETEMALAAKVKAKGAAFVECPVGGTVGPAKDGKLFGFAGGGADDVARAKPVLDQMCRPVHPPGPARPAPPIKLPLNL